LIDAHCHLNFNAYKEDADEVISRSLEQGIGMFVVGSQSTTSARAVDYAARYDGVWAIVGLHPIHLFEQEVDEAEVEFRSRRERFDPGHYRTLAERPEVVGIGECGLDYHHRPSRIDEGLFRSRQEETFRAQIELSLELGLPLMIHCREAHEEVLRVLEDYRRRGQVLRGDVHCFSGTRDIAARYLDLGFHISFTGNLTYKPRVIEGGNGETLQDVARQVPLERLLVETDAPYLAPVPHRGERNEPAFVRHIAEKIAEIKGLTYEEVARQTMLNTRRLFGV